NARHASQPRAPQPRTNPSAARPLRTNVEAEAPIGGMGIHRQYAPVHVLSARATPFSETDIWLPLTRALPASTRCPEGPVTVTELNAGSSFCVNQSVSSRGGFPTLLPTRGSAWSRKAWAHASPVASTSESGAIAIRDECRIVNYLGKGLAGWTGPPNTACRSRAGRCHRGRGAAARSRRHCGRFAG